MGENPTEGSSFSQKRRVPTFFFKLASLTTEPRFDVTNQSTQLHRVSGGSRSLQTLSVAT